MLISFEEVMCSFMRWLVKCDSRGDKARGSGENKVYLFTGPRDRTNGAPCRATMEKTPSVARGRGQEQGKV
jgi:hypothetical protein